MWPGVAWDTSDAIGASRLRIPRLPLDRVFVGLYASGVPDNGVNVIQFSENELTSRVYHGSTIECRQTEVPVKPGETALKVSTSEARL